MTTFSAHLIHRITFQEQITEVDADGFPTTSWVPVSLGLGTVLENVPAEVLTGPGREFEQSGQTQADIVARIRCPWFPGGIKASWRILWDGYVFNIGGIPDMDATGRREYRIKCTAGVNEG